MKNLKKQFPATSSYTYLNTAASGLLSETLLDFRQSHDLDFLVQGSVLKENQDKLISGVREDLGAFFNCGAQRVALVPNFSFGFNAVLEGLPQTHKILLLDNDYPSINRAVNARNFEVCYAAIGEKLEDHILEAVEREKPQAFIFSIVQYINGIKIDFDFLKKLKESYPELLLIADGTQYCGVEHFNFEESGIDVLGASTYKWLNAAYGNGFFLFKSGMEEQIFPKNMGFGSTMGKYKAEKDTLIGALEPGHLDTLNFGSLGAALKLINKIGLQNITQQINLLKNKAFEAFAERGLLEEKVVKRQYEHSSIFNIKGDEKLFHTLRGKDILCSQRGDGLRISFHFYNNVEDLELLLEILKY